MGSVTNITEHRKAAEHHRREGYRIKLNKGLWRGFDVEIEPPTDTHPLRYFKTYDEAMVCALMIQRTEGWPIFGLDAPEMGGAA